MLDKEFIYEYNGVSYPVIVTKKRIKNIIYRFKDDKFYVSSPYFALKRDILNGLNKYADRLINSQKKIRPENSPIGEDYIYIFGDRYPLYDSGIIVLSGEEISYSNKEELLYKLNKIYLRYVTNRTREYEKLMDLPPYRIKVKNMKSRYGSNSRQTKTISYSTMLLHYEPNIIDSVIIHELAHDVVFNHSKKFYDYVYKYCPNYKYYHKKLRKGEFK